MNIGAYKGAASLAAYEKWQEMISQNIAASSVPGFKMSEVSFSSVNSDRTRLNPNATFAHDLQGVMPQASAKTSFTQGELRHTASELDFAIQGPGFFQVQRESGDLAYTRNGEFKVSPDLTLTTSSGLPVMGDSGPIVFKKGEGKISINADGEIIQGDQKIAKLAVYDFQDPQGLRRLGRSLFVPVDGKTQSQAVEKPQVISGYLEGSNVSPLSQMVNLVTVSRAYEASQKVIQSDDDNTEKAIQTLGNPAT